MDWEPNDDGEYNEARTYVNGRLVTVFSDRTGEHWSMTIDDGDMIDLDATDEAHARIEALTEAQQ